MIIDKLCEFLDATALNTGGADNYFIGSAVNANVARDLGMGQPLYLVVTVDTAIDSTSDNTVQEIQLRSDDSSSIDPDSGTLHATTGALTQAQWNALGSICIPLPVEGLAYEEYLGIVQVTSVAAATAGKLNAFLTMDPHSLKIYPEGQN